MIVNVAVSVIFDHNRNVLITRRASEGSHGGLWEFPGGKCEQHETALMALKREIREEVGLDIHHPEFLMIIEHSYPHMSVRLFVYCVYEFDGNPSRQESQTDMRWVAVSRLQEFEFPEANKKIIERLAGYREEKDMSCPVAEDQLSTCT